KYTPVIKMGVSQTSKDVLAMAGDTGGATIVIGTLSWLKKGGMNTVSLKQGPAGTQTKVSPAWQTSKPTPASGSVFICSSVVSDTGRVTLNSDSQTTPP